MSAKPKFFRHLLDPRFLLGLTLILGGGTVISVLLGDSNRIILSQVTNDIPLGYPVTSNDIVAVEMPANVAEAYLPYSDVGTGEVAQRTLRAGQLLLPADLGPAVSGVVVRVPLIVAPASSLRVGDYVSLWHIAEASVSLDSHARVISEDAVIVGITEDQALVDSGISAELRIAETDVEAVLAVLGTQDGFAIVGQS